MSISGGRVKIQDWSPNIVQGKYYNTENSIGQQLWGNVEQTLRKYNTTFNTQQSNQLQFEQKESRYKEQILSKVRLGQSAFRIMVTDAYKRKCSVSGEKTLPVLEAAHIKSYSQMGPSYISNSLLLRSDLHKLFDAGYLTVAKEYKVPLMIMPVRRADHPDKSFLDWHNKN